MIDLVRLKWKKQTNSEIFSMLAGFLSIDLSISCEKSKETKTLMSHSLGTHQSMLLKISA